MAFKPIHGAIDTTEYFIWRSMKRRCDYPKHKHYKYYGGRGIFVCEAWTNSFVQFRADMGMRPSPKHTLDRIDNDGPYSPENCRWATMQEQSRNKRHGYGTSPGSANGCAKLTEAEVAEIRRRYRRGLGKVLGREFGVKNSTICSIASGKSWKAALAAGSSC